MATSAVTKSNRPAPGVSRGPRHSGCPRRGLSLQGVESPPQPLQGGLRPPPSLGSQGSFRSIEVCSRLRQEAVRREKKKKKKIFASRTRKGCAAAETSPARAAPPNQSPQLFLFIGEGGCPAAPQEAAASVQKQNGDGEGAFTPHSPRKETCFGRRSQSLNQEQAESMTVSAKGAASPELSPVAAVWGFSLHPLTAPPKTKQDAHTKMQEGQLYLAAQRTGSLCLVTALSLNLHPHITSKR